MQHISAERISWKEALKREMPLMLPVAHDALTAKLIERAGFTALQVGGSYLIYAEVSYKYVPVVGYVMAKAGINLSDFTYTRPRQSSCVMYNTTVCTTT